MLSAVSMAFSSAQVTMMEKIVIAFFARCRREPSEVSRPMQRWASLTTCSWALNLGTKRKVMLSTRLSAGITRPKR